MERFISITWSDGIRDDESEILIDQVGRTVKWLYFMLPTALSSPPAQLRIFGDWTMPGMSADIPYRSARWYIETSYSEDLQQVIAPLYLELVRKEPWQIETPHWDLALIDQDLTDYPTAGSLSAEPHYALGASLPGSSTVMSVHRIRELTDAHIRSLALRRLIRHNLGHIMGAASYKRDYRTVKHGIETHCANVCAMRHTGSVEELISNAIEENALEQPFCEQCTREMLANLLFHMKNWS